MPTTLSSGEHTIGRVRINGPVLTAVRLIKFRDGTRLPTSATPESSRVMVATEEISAPNQLTQVTQDHLAPSAKEVSGITQPVVEYAPASEISINEVTSISVVSLRSTEDSVHSK